MHSAAQTVYFLLKQIKGPNLQNYIACDDIGTIIEYLATRDA